ncbi:unnamed protein product, partial [marine sediment metagenome]
MILSTVLVLAVVSQGIKQTELPINAAVVKTLNVNYAASTGQFLAVPDIVLGDANGDGELNFLDVVPFGTALFNRGAYEIMFPGC